MRSVSLSLAASAIAAGVDAWAKDYGYDRLLDATQQKTDLVSEVASVFGNRVQELPAPIRGAIRYVAGGRERNLVSATLDALWAKGPQWRGLLQADMNLWYAHLHRALLGVIEALNSTA